MTRQVYLVFYGNERWSEITAAEHEAHAEEPVGDHGDDHAIEPLEASVRATGIPAHSEPGPERPGAAGAKSGPHESPPSMTLPLIVLAILAAIGGIINLPFLKQELDFLALWLEPVFETARAASPRDVRPRVRALDGRAGRSRSSASSLGARSYKNGLGAKGEDPVEAKLGGFAKVLANAYYLDIGLARFVSGPVTTMRELARATSSIGGSSTVR